MEQPEPGAGPGERSVQQLVCDTLGTLALGQAAHSALCVGGNTGTSDCIISLPFFFLIFFFFLPILSFLSSRW